jgi:hypothetical protein
MVNPESPTFRFFEKVGYISGKLIRVILIGTAIRFVSKKLGGFMPIPTQPPTQP